MPRAHPLLLAAALALPIALPLLGTALAQRPAYTPGPQNITLPEGWESRFIRFATLDNAQRKIVRNFYVNPEAFAAAKPGQPLPEGTLIILADNRARLAANGTPLRDQQGRLIPEPGWAAIGVQQKEPGWGEGYGPEKRNGTWEYARFNGDGSRNPASVEACFTCHLQARPQQDFAFNFWDFVQSRQ
ncbi:MAG: hypothetical protein EON47_01320 [Acetobacteraceae bacterium]|nr:MAG: hypothetical protein EON47_01320 [Acetobacteraceae bacterium]